ncbi:MAG TPA: hypothetical protein VGR74_18660, partial [Actinomycetota bacterium]|nr:hypothetical protein [Actinomycetota bacterium]
MTTGLGTAPRRGGSGLAPHPRTRRRRRLVWLSLLTLAVLVVLGGWLALSLLGAARQVRHEAGAARSQLGRAAKALRGGDE